MTKDRSSQLPSSAENRMKLHTAPITVFIHHYRVSTPADDPQRRYAAGLSTTRANDTIQTGGLPRVRPSDRTMTHEACKRRSFDVAGQGVAGQENGQRLPRGGGRLTKKEFFDVPIQFQCHFPATKHFLTRLLATSALCPRAVGS